MENDYFTQGSQLFGFDSNDRKYKRMMLMMMMMGDEADADDTQGSQDSDLVCLSPTTKMSQSWSKPEGTIGYNGVQYGVQ